jgi:uncharacterized membrane protein YphA (DoxX/SURF4 family)
MNASETVTLSDSTFAMPAWQKIVGHIAAVLIAIIFLAAGLAKMTMPFQFQQMMEQLKVPVWGSLPLVFALGVVETTAAVLVLIPKYRRIGGWMLVGLLVIFMGYIGINYNALVGQDCSCFPWLKRAVNPAFFAEDGAMLAAALLAAWFSKKSAGLKLQQPQWAEGFFHDTKFKAHVSTNTAELRKLFVFNYPPYGVALDNGRVKGIVSHYDEPQPEADLRNLGLIE